MAELKDTYGRKITYLRISVTDRCNLRCYYCVPNDKFVLKKREEILSLEEIARVVKVAVSLGMTKIRFTGGEPLLRKGIDRLMERVASTPEVTDISLTTNGILLKRFAPRLQESGLRRINVSLDTLNPGKFRKITGINLWHQVMRGIEEALIRFDKVKLNVVAIRGTNDDEIFDFVEFVRDKPLSLRFIEFMPIGDNGWSWNQFVPSSFIKNQIERKYELKRINHDSKSESVELYQINSFKGNLGFISAISHGFCYNCNRLRLTADGFLKPCLSSDAEIDIKSKIRGGAKDDELVELFQQALTLKPKEHNLIQRGGSEIRSLIHGRRMFQIGG